MTWLWIFTLYITNIHEKVPQSFFRHNLHRWKFGREKVRPRGVRCEEKVQPLGFISARDDGWMNGGSGDKVFVPRNRAGGCSQRCEMWRRTAYADVLSPLFLVCIIDSISGGGSEGAGALGLRCAPAQEHSHDISILLLLLSHPHIQMYSRQHDLRPQVKETYICVYHSLGGFFSARAPLFGLSPISRAPALYFSRDCQIKWRRAALHCLQISKLKIKLHALFYAQSWLWFASTIWFSSPVATCSVSQAQKTKSM